MSPIIKHTLAILAIVAGCIVFSVTLVRAVWYAPEEGVFSVPTFFSPFSSTTKAVSTPDSWPVRLSIPSLGVAANVQAVGVGKTGNMAVPTNYTDVAWYKGGTSPGHIGSAVFDGHVDNGFGLDGVFKHLGDIAIGAHILVTTKDGTTYTYGVDRTEAYPYDAVPTDTIFHSDDAAHLVIITCDGVWISGKKTYDHRLVVYATLQ